MQIWRKHFAHAHKKHDKMCFNKVSQEHKGAEMAQELTEEYPAFERCLPEENPWK